jgi:hypothetical protein
MLIAGLLAVATLGALASTGLGATPTTSDTVVDCPPGGFLPEGSQCRWISDGDGFWLVVSRPTPPPPCERVVSPPPDALVSTCRVEPLDHEVGDSALISYETADGGRVRVWVLPSGDIIVLG